ncbi:hypothetical protein K438DRAFT_1748290 [Mycena galopus ATCC 62051]|nr:hypothetical protein K438DRAFT_1748290 [Mycena galopus ATCC 62051]
MRLSSSGRRISYIGERPRRFRPRQRGGGQCGRSSPEGTDEWSAAEKVGGLATMWGLDLAAHKSSEAPISGVRRFRARAGGYHEGGGRDHTRRHLRMLLLAWHSTPTKMHGKLEAGANLVSLDLYNKLTDYFANHFTPIVQHLGARSMRLGNSGCSILDAGPRFGVESDIGSREASCRVQAPPREWHRRLPVVAVAVPQPVLGEARARRGDSTHSIPPSYLFFTPLKSPTPQRDYASIDQALVKKSSTRSSPSAEGGGERCEIFACEDAERVGRRGGTVCWTSTRTRTCSACTPALLARIPKGLKPLRRKFEARVKAAGLGAVSSRLVAVHAASADKGANKRRTKKDEGKARALDPKAYYVDALLAAHEKSAATVARRFKGKALDKAYGVF